MPLIPVGKDNAEMRTSQYVIKYSSIVSAFIVHEITFFCSKVGLPAERAVLSLKIRGVTSLLEIYLKWTRSSVHTNMVIKSHARHVLKCTKTKQKKATAVTDSSTGVT